MLGWERIGLKIYDMDEGSQEDPFSVVEKWKKEGFSIVWTNGCFDLFHAGHARGLAEARDIIDVGKPQPTPLKLIVGVNNDHSVSLLKGDARPVIPLASRMSIVASHECVDMVIAVKSTSPLGLIEMIKPKWIVKSEDWRGGVVIGAGVAAAQGGRVMFTRMISDNKLNAISTTAIIKKIRESPNRSTSRIDQDFLTIEELSSYTKIRVSALKTLVRTKKIPHAKVLGQIIFSKDRVAAWLCDLDAKSLRKLTQDAQSQKPQIKTPSPPEVEPEKQSEPPV
jgi:rfaE bifunctional protein nucleotidyltransferase chain/domain